MRRRSPLLVPLTAALLAIPPASAPQAAAAQSPPPQIDVEDLPAEGEAVPGEAPPAEPLDAMAAAEAEAQREYADGNLTRALELYVDLAARHEDAAARARFGITSAWLSFQLGDREVAYGRLVDVLFADPSAPLRAELYAPEFVALYQDAQRDATDRRAREAAERTSLAVDAIRVGRHADARRELERALQLAPDDPDILYNLALVDLREERPDAALAGFERVLALERTRPRGVDRELKSQTLNNVAVLYFARGDYEVARASLEDALRLDPDDARAWFNLGLTRQRLGLAEEGYAALRKARDLDRRDVDIARALALAQIERSSWVEAVALLLEGTRERPEDPDLWLHLGRAQRGLGNVEGALESWRHAVELDPGNRAGVASAAAVLRAESLYARGDFAGAGLAAGQAVELANEDVDAWMLLGLARDRQGDAAGARQALERARALAPGRADVAQNLGSVALAQRDFPAAEAAFRAVLEIDPDNVEVRGVLDRLVADREAAALAAQSSGRRGSPPPKRARPDLGARLSAADYEPLGIRGLVVDEVVPGGAAERAGLAVGDLVLRIDGQPAKSAETLRAQAAGRAQGVVLDVLRAGKPVRIRLELK